MNFGDTLKLIAESLRVALLGEWGDLSEEFMRGNF